MLAVVRKAPILLMDTVAPNGTIWPSRLFKPMLLNLPGALVGTYKGVSENEFLRGRFAESLRAYDRDHGPPSILFGKSCITHMTEKIWIENKFVYATINVPDTYYGRRLSILMDRYGIERFKLFGEATLLPDGPVAIVTQFVLQSLDYYV